MTNFPAHIYSFCSFTLIIRDMSFLKYSPRMIKTDISGPTKVSGFDVQVLFNLCEISSFKFDRTVTNRFAISFIKQENVYNWNIFHHQVQETDAVDTKIYFYAKHRALIKRVLNTKGN